VDVRILAPGDEVMVDDVEAGEFDHPLGARR
jgi:hypothetical protein